MAADSTNGKIQPGGGEGGQRRVSPRRVVILLALLIGAGIAIKSLYFSRQFVFAGTLEVTKVDLSSQVSSTIATVIPQEGDRVTTGEVLVTLTCQDLKVASDLANINFNRNRRLFKAGTISPENMDLIVNRKQDADVRLGWCTIRSPINGTVLTRYHEPGEWVNPGTKLLTLANIKDIWAYIYVPQPEVARLSLGEKLTSILPELNNREFTGTIIKINEEAEFTPKNVQTEAERTRLVYGVKVSYLGVNDDEILKPGMTLEVRLPKR